MSKALKQNTGDSYKEADSPFAGDFISDLAIQKPNVSHVKSHLQQG